MKKTTWTRLILMLAALFCVFGTTVFAKERCTTPQNAVSQNTSHGAMGWYFKKNDDHTLPPLDENLSYITQYGGYYADTEARDDDRVIYLTFDAGYENGNVEKILNVLKKHDAQGAFFVLSHLIEAEPDLVRRMVSEGHLVCNHSANHRDMTTLSEGAFCEELSSLAALFKETTGRDMAMYYRPPEGKFSETSLSYAQNAGYKTIFWSLAYPDWDNDRQPDPEKAKETLLSHTHNGMVLLMHPTSATNAAILDDLLTSWETDGYRFGSLDELTAKATAAKATAAKTTAASDSVRTVGEKEVTGT